MPYQYKKIERVLCLYRWCETLFQAIQAIQVIQAIRAIQVIQVIHEPPRESHYLIWH